MELETGFIESIKANPDDELSRLVFADWLEEHGRPECAEFIRLSCAFDPHRDRFDDESINQMRDRLRQMNAAEMEAEKAWLESLHRPMREGVRIEWRRGFVDSLALPVQWFLEYGEQLRHRYALLRKLVIFRLNGWGERLARCEWLRGIRELELACWYGDEDMKAVANSPFLSDVERLVLWEGGSEEQTRMAAWAAAWPKLRELHFVSRGGRQQWVEAVNEVAGRPLVTVYDFGSELFPFAADFAWGHYGFYIGKLPDGTQLFAYAEEDEPAASGWLFEPDGRKRERFRFEFPPELTLPAERPLREDVRERMALEDQVRLARRSLLAERFGFRPAFIRVEQFSLDDEEFGPHRFIWTVEERWGSADDPNQSPEADDWPMGGHGERIYLSVRRGEYNFDFGNDWWCDRTGHVNST
jgi:uncharacterized protein (TIGR02996 family)